MTKILFKATVFLLLLSFNWAAREAIPLWKIDHPQGSIYLLGSVHLLKEQIAPYRDAIENAFMESRVLVVEADIGAENMMVSAGKMMRAGMFSDDRGLDTFLTPKRYTELDQILKELGFDLKDYRKYRPWMLAMTISSLSMMKQGYNPMFGVDLYFLNRARERDMDIAELEGVDFQIQLFLNMSPKEEEAFLFSSILEQKEQQNIVDQLVDSWKTGKLDQMISLLENQELENPELKNFYQSLLQKRNEKMADKIESYLSEGERCFVIVGAAHLLGKSGVVELLRKKGITLSSI